MMSNSKVTSQPSFSSDKIWLELIKIRENFEQHLSKISHLQALIDAEDRVLFACLDEEERLLKLLEQEQHHAE